MDVSVGDVVQIKNGGMDVTNGLRAKSGKWYGEGGPLTATVVLIDPNWRTGGAHGLPSVVTKVRCVGSDGNTVVWQVRPEDIVVVIKKSEPVQTEPEPTPTVDPEPEIELAPPIAIPEEPEEPEAPEEPQPSPRLPRATASKNYYAPKQGADTWVTGPATQMADSIPRWDPITIADEKVPLASQMDAQGSVSWRAPAARIQQSGAQVSVVKGMVSRQLDSDGNPIPPSISVDHDQNILETTWPVLTTDSDKKAELLKENITTHQNPLGYPYTSSSMKSKKNEARTYDFQIIPGDPRFKSLSSLENKLRDFRAAAGIPVHGTYHYAKLMKYFMYNRFKSPDTNLLHNKSVTYVFFSRPDLNILNGLQCAPQCLAHTEAALVWRRYPELFKLLVDAKRTGDANNFNMLLSNQVTSFDIRDEELSTLEAGKSWNEYTMPYGDQYNGRTSGEFSCNFTETSDYSVINLIKLWVTYIDNVGRGAWKPSYSLKNESDINMSHVFTKTLDYAASAYVFKCGPDGEDILYWSKYYGVFPISTGAGALSWDNDSPIGNAPKLSVRFKYAWKRDLSPISLLEFNNLAKISSSPTSENSFNAQLNHSARPFVGTPFIEMFLAEPRLVANGVESAQGRTSLRLKFKRGTEINGVNDNVLYRNSLAYNNMNS